MTLVVAAEVDDPGRQMIRVTINGRLQELDGPTTLIDLVDAEAGSRLDGVAVGVNRRVIPRSEWPDFHINEGDEVEIIAPFAGG